MQRPEDTQPFTLYDLPPEERPRERLLYLGPQALSTIELLAIVIGTGHGDDHVLHLAQTLLQNQKGLPGISQASLTELQSIRGIGVTKSNTHQSLIGIGAALDGCFPH